MFQAAGLRSWVGDLCFRVSGLRVYVLGFRVLGVLPFGCTLNPKP